MKMFSNRLGTAFVLAGIALVGLLPGALAVLPGSAQNSELADFDLRGAAAKSAERLAERNVGFNALKQRLPGATASFDRQLDSPRLIQVRSGFLTGPNGEGLGVAPQTAAAYSVSDPNRSVRAFIDQHAQLFGHNSSVLDSAAVNRDSVGAHNGLRTVVWQQRHAGLPVFSSVLIANITSHGELAMIGSHFLPDVSTAAGSVTPAQASVSSAQAVATALGNLGETATANDVIAAGASGDFQKVTVHGIAAYGRLVWLPMNRATLRLAWELYVRNSRSGERYQELVDAQSGQVLVRRNITRHISDASYNVYTSDSPAPFSPGWPTPNPGQPPFTNRVLVTLPALDTTASPNGWINDGDNETQGNNVDAFVDRDFNQQPDGGARPTGTPNRVFDFPLDLTQAPLTYSNAAVVQMFYWVNWYHDQLYRLGFTESAGNYQNDNFGRGGLGNDRIISYTQAGANIGLANNAFFAPAPDGISGEIAMFVFPGPNPDRDGDLDADVILHEASHGTSTRLVGGGVGISALQTGGMGEGWSDFYGLSLLSDPSDDPDAVYATGGYATFQFFGLPQNYYFGIRHFPYTTDMTKNPFTFKDIDPTQISPHAGVPRSPIYPFDAREADEVHHQGEIWCVTLWEVRANLIHKYGSPGNQLMLQLVTDAMKLSPANPTMLEARDAILLADVVNNGGFNTADIWAGFAKRGMGVSATSPTSDTTVGVVEAFDVPGLQVDHTLLSGGNGNGIIDINECNQLDIILKNNSLNPATGVSIRLATTNRGVTFGSKFSNYIDIQSGQTATNLTPFTISTSPAFICGTPIVLSVTIKSDEETSVTGLVLSTGTNGPPLRFDNTTPIAIPDLNLTGTNSPILVSNITSAISKVMVSLYLQHSYDADLTLQLISPEGITNTLSANNGFSLNDYGAACSPDTFRTTFDDDAAVSITAGVPPFIGSFKPQQPFSASFVGKFGTNVNGIWQLRIIDSVGLDLGVLNCWSLFLSPAQCLDGGGGCPGADVSVGLKDAPDPSFVGSNLVYTITVTNIGPSAAKSTVVNHSLPPSVQFISAISSQGSCLNSGNLVICTLGTIPVDGTATITVTVRPTAVGTLTSSATVSSSEFDPDNGNNTATTLNVVNPPTADLALGLIDAPDPSTVGGSLTYSIAVTNNGPSTASGVMVTNTLSPSLTVQTALGSQGTAIIAGNVVVFNLGSLTNGGRATATITVTPTVEGTVSATSVVSANQADPILASNTRTATTVVGPASDLAITMTDFPDPAVVGSNWTYTVDLVNQGPSAANNVGATITLPPNVTLVSNYTSFGTLVINGNLVTTSLGSMNVGATVKILLVVNSATNGVFNASAAVSSSSADPSAVNNSAGVTTTVLPPTISIIPAGATLTAENIAPNGAVDVGETVTVTFRLRNAGNIPNTGLVATLLATNGVTAPSAPVNYGVLSPSSVAVGGSFTFTANGVEGGTVTPTLQLQDGANNLGLVSFSFVFPVVTTFSNTAAITIPDQGAASPYPSIIVVSNIVNPLSHVTVTLSNLNHTFTEDLDVLLVGPGGQKVMLMSDAGAPNGVVNTTVNFDDGGGVLPQNGPILATTYAPADYIPGNSLPGGAPAAPYATVLSAFNGGTANGNWSLYIADHSNGDLGNVANGWRLTLTSITPVNQIADLAVTGGGSANPALVGSLLTYTFTVTNAGPNAASSASFTNVVPPTATLISVISSQGGISTNGNTVVAGLGAIPVGGTAQVTVSVIPNAPGSLVNTATVGAGETDLNSANNSGSVTTTVNLPLADLVISQVTTNTVIVGSNMVISLVVSNQGPQTALNAGITDVLPAGLSFVSATPSIGSANHSAGTVTASFGSLSSGASASLSIVVTAASTGLKTNAPVATTTSSDTVATNSTASAVINVVPPTAHVIAAGVTLLSESFEPANGTIDNGETVTVSLALQNVGSANTTNLWAILQATGGVNSPSGAQPYGLIPINGTAARTYTFTASGTNGGAVTATLLLDDQGPVGFAMFPMYLPGSTTFANTNTVTIPDHGAAAPYPSAITVSGLTGLVSKVSVTLNGITHAFPDDLDVLLVSPTGQKVVLMSDAGGGHGVTNTTITFDDVGTALPDSALITSGTYAPADYETGDTFPAPAPAGAVGSVLGLFNGANPNGTWSLYVVDDSTGDAGTIAGGWSLNVTVVSPLTPVADVSVSITSLSGNPLFQGFGLTNVITVTNRGPSAASGITATYVIPAEFTYVSSSGSQGTIGAVESVVTANVGSLAAGTSAQYSVRLVAAQGGAVANTVNSTAGTSDLNLANNSATLTTLVTVPQTPIFGETTLKSNGQVEITLLGQVGLKYVISASTNLNNWTPISTNTVPGTGSLKFIDNTSLSQRFYRASLAP